MILRLKAILGYTWAVLLIFVVLATFIGMQTWAKGLATATGVQVSPKYTGGEVVRTVPGEQFRTSIHRPVFASLIGESSEGFVQIDWAPPEGKSLPPVFDQDIDYDGNGTPDFHVRFDTRTNSVTMRPLSPNVVSVEEVLNFGSDRAVRIRVRNPRGRLGPSR